MKSIKLEKVFKKLTLIFFTLFLIGMIIGYILDAVFNIKTNPQYLAVWAIFMIGFIALAGILWDIFYLINKSKAIAHVIREDKEEIKEIGNSIAEIPNDIKNNYINLMKNDKVSLKDKILGTLFIVWFIVSILLIICFKNNIKVEIILFSQCIIVFTLLIIFGHRKK